MQSKKLFFLTVLLALALLPAVSVRGDSGPRLWVTWRAATYLPPDYSGRALPIEGSQLVVAVDAVNGGRLDDLSGQTVYWYVNDNFLAGGQGMTRATLTVPQGASVGGLSVRVSLPDYQSGLSKTISIPVVNPRVFLLAPASAQSSIFSVQALPFYFNVQNSGQLNFQWTVAGETPAPDADPSVLTVSLSKDFPAGGSVPITLTVQNPNGLLETDSTQVSIPYNPAP